MNRQFVRSNQGKVVTEAFVVLAILIIMWIIGVREYRGLQAFSEQMIYERSVAVLERAVVLEYNHQLMRGTKKPITHWQTINPFAMLSEPLRGYVGEISEDKMLEMLPMEWAYIPSQHMVVYRVSSTDYFSSQAPDFQYIRLSPQMLESSKTASQFFTLQPLEPFEWHTQD